MRSLIAVIFLLLAGQSHAAGLDVLDHSELLNSTETRGLCTMAREVLESQSKNIAIVLGFISQHESLRADLESVGILERARAQLSKKKKLARSADNDTVIAVLRHMLSADDFEARTLISTCVFSWVGNFFANRDDIKLAQQRAKKLIHNVSDVAQRTKDAVVTKALGEILEGLE